MYLRLNGSWSCFRFGKKSVDVTASYFSEDEATVVSAIEPGKKGRIILHGVFWFARASSKSYGTIPEGALVVEVDRVGNTLIVQPTSSVVAPLPSSDY